MKRITFFVLLLALEHSSYSQNLVANPGFENWSSSSKPVGWTHVENCTKDSAAFITGSYSCRHSGGTSTTSDLGQSISVVAGKSYTLSINFKTQTVAGGNGARIWCYWKDASGTNLSDPLTDQILRPSSYLKSEGWQKLSVSIIAPPAAAYFYLEVRTYVNSVTWWEDFLFAEDFSTGMRDEFFKDLVLFPNPSGSILNISGLIPFSEIEISDISGRQWIESFIVDDSQTSISLEGLHRGMYLARIRSANRITFKAFIKNGN